MTLVRHPPVYCVVPAGGFSPDHQRWIRPKYAGFFVPVNVLSRMFRGKFVAALRRAYVGDALALAGATEGLRHPAQWHAFVNALFHTDWVVYAKPAFGGATAVLRAAAAPAASFKSRYRTCLGTAIGASVHPLGPRHFR